MQEWIKLVICWLIPLSMGLIALFVFAPEAAAFALMVSIPAMALLLCLESRKKNKRK